MTTLLLLAVGLGAPGVGLLVARWLTTEEDVARSMRRYQEALAVLGEAAARRP